MEKKFGYNFNRAEEEDPSKSFITLPYADDFCLITTHQRTHQKLINTINTNIESMGMLLKPSKCRSFSISRGSSKVVDFYIGPNRVPSIAEEEQKFLGRVIFYTGKSSETIAYLRDIFIERLDNIEKTLIRPEYKLWIYSRYFLPAIRFLLTVHDVTATDLSSLDRLTHKYLKKWAGLPRCATNAVFHLRNGLNIPSISSLYDEAHCLSHATTRMKGDPAVNYILDRKVERESEYTRKKSVTVRAEAVYQESLSFTTIDGIPQGERWEKQGRQRIEEVKEAVKSQVRYDNEKVWSDHVKTLVKQGHLLELAKCQNTDLTWKSFIFNLKKGTLKFILNSTLDTLATNANLKSWGKSASDKCSLPNCGVRQTTAHVLSNCKVSLPRMTWRHDGILNYIAQVLDKSRFEFYVDIPGYKTSAGGTVPVSTGLIAEDRPDIVLIDRKAGTFDIFELTVSFDREENFSAAHRLKDNRYGYYLTDMTALTPSVTSFEIGARGSSRRTTASG